MIQAILLAQGQGKRLDGVIDRPKQLLEVGAETIIGRTVRMLRARGVHDVTIVARPVPAWKAFAESAGVKLATLEDTGPSVAAGVYRTRHLWESDAVAVMLGDTIFSAAVMNRIVGHEHDAVAFSRSGFMSNPCTGKRWAEVYALRFSGDGKRRYIDFCLDRENAGIHYTLYTVQDAVPGIVKMDVEDYTDDIDFAEELENLPKLAEQSRMEGA